MWTTGNSASCQHGKNIFRNGCVAPPNTNHGLLMATPINTQDGGAIHLVENYVL